MNAVFAILYTDEWDISLFLWFDLDLFGAKQ